MNIMTFLIYEQRKDFILNKEEKIYLFDKEKKKKTFL